MYEIDLLKLSEFFKNEVIVEQRKKIKELEKKLSDDSHYQERLLRNLEVACINYEELEKENETLKVTREKLLLDKDVVEESLKTVIAENEELKKANKHIEHNRNQKAYKLKRIEKLITACSTGYTDDFIKSILAILLEVEE